MLVAAPSAQAPAPFFANDRVVVVANAASPFSLALARRYCELRHVPATHLLALDGVPGNAATAQPATLEECRERILRPIDRWMGQRGLTDVVDAIVYSSGFPHAVDLGDLPACKQPYIGKLAALTGVTCFLRQVVAGDMSGIGLDANRYAPSLEGARARLSTAQQQQWQQAQAALRRKDFAAARQLLQALTAASVDGGLLYDLACCEALLGERDAAFASLQRAADAGFYNAVHAEADADLQSLRADARFQPLLQRMREHAPGSPPARGFGDAEEGRGKLYLSVMLAWLGPFGSSYDEACEWLQRSAAADGTQPQGTFYFLQNGDVRATTRMPLFAVAMAALQRQGRRAELLRSGFDGQDGVLPKGKDDVLGAVVGIANFDWSKCQSRIVPGAIVEHLTSFGATYQTNGQTKLTAFLRAGAAGASGTVTEPYALQAKFPTPLIHGYYTAGCSLAEAFYQSVRGPYQLLIVGDACCRPFATLQAPTLDASEAPWVGEVELAPQARGAARCEAWIDGALLASGPVGAPLRIDSRGLADGPHELHLVAIGPAPVSVPTAITRTITVSNHGLQATLHGPGKAVELGRQIVLTGRAPAGARWQILTGATLLASGSGSMRAEVPSAVLGLGRSSLRLLAMVGDHTVVSAPIDVETTAAVCKGSGKAPGAVLPGLAVDLGSGSRLRRLGVMAFADPLPVPAGATATVRGSFQLADAGLYEWSCGSGELRGLSLDGGTMVDDHSDGGAGAHGIVLDLAAGWHTFELQVRGGAVPARLSLGGPKGAVRFEDATCGQAPFELQRLAKDKLTAKQVGWCDGDRQKAVACDGECAEVDFAATKVGAVLCCLVGLPGAVDPATELRVETRDGGGWTAVRSADLRVLHSSDGVTSVLAVVGGRKAQHLRLRGKPGVLATLTEVEVYVGTPK